MRWITARELAQISGRAERTITHYASQGRLKVKKSGKSWLIDPLSAVKAGFKIPSEFLESLKIPLPQILPNDIPSENKAPLIAVEKVETIAKKYKRLKELGVYNELLILFHAIQGTLPQQIADYMKRCLHYIALGFYEYSREKKADFYKQARIFLVQCLVENDVTPPNSQEANSWALQVEESLLPGINGLIRNQERKSSRGETRKSKTSY
ncbi:MAG: hypothetical protein PHX61_12300 [Alphaproteobacteria bacterium]|nr:hypothetical protein [Alphaproteobacteria bacterium]